MFNRFNSFDSITTAPTVNFDNSELEATHTTSIRDGCFFAAMGIKQRTDVYYQAPGAGAGGAGAGSRTHCRAKGCKECHTYHYCDRCGDKNSNHRARNCPHAAKIKKVGDWGTVCQHIRRNGRQCEYYAGWVKLCKTCSKCSDNCKCGRCRAPGCKEHHNHHYCDRYGDDDSTHRARHCPHPR